MVLLCTFSCDLSEAASTDGMFSYVIRLFSILCVTIWSPCRRVMNVAASSDASVGLTL